MGEKLASAGNNDLAATSDTKSRAPLPDVIMLIWSLLTANIK